MRYSSIWVTLRLLVHPVEPHGITQVSGIHAEHRLGERTTPHQDRHIDARMMRAAALLAWASGLGFGLPGIYAIWHLLAARSPSSWASRPTVRGSSRISA
jgi:hypothetical protein